MDFPAPGVRFLNINVSNFDAWKLDGIAMLADAREAMTPSTRAGRRRLAGGWGAQIESVQSRQLKETQRVYQAVWQEKAFVPEDRRSSRSRIGVSRISPDHRLHPDPEQRPGVLNETLPADAVIVAAAGSLPGDLQRVWRNRAPITWSTATPAWDMKSTPRWA
jgi:3D-(3,5/4)-trihydroxycyclohexane-1,2-dione acylhydrolase (decyclizing)